MSQSPYYAELFQEMQPDVDPRHIEAWIRTEHPTLDGLSWAALSRESSRAVTCIEMAGADMAERLAQTFGL